MSIYFVDIMQSSLPQKSSTPLNDQQYQQLGQLLGGMNPQQLLWTGGLLTGLALQGGGAAGAVADAAGGEVTILVGSQTGNSEKLAALTLERARAKGIGATIKKMGDYKANQLKQEKFVLVIVSTHGEGEPPDQSKELYEFLYSKRAPKLAETSFAVLGLGDSSYEHFCKMGVDFDTRFEELGATRLHPRIDCDVDYEEPASDWIDAVLTTLAERVEKQAPAASTSAATLFSPAVESVYTKQNPFPAEVLEDIVLNGRGSAKETHHIELSLEGSGLTYEPGDALGICPVNAPELVEQLLASLHCQGDEKVTVGKDETTFHDALQRQLEITLVTRPVAKKYAALSNSKALDALLAEDKKSELHAYLEGRDLIDLVNEHPVGEVEPQQIVDCLRKIPPRLYSISSSLKQHPDEVHLTVSAVRYEAHGRARKGLCSTYLADRRYGEGQVPVYLSPNDTFKLPADPNAPIIMIGPGTGVAPFRAFVEEREAIGAAGKNWLFFGDQHFMTDFLYQAEWQRYFKAGILSKLSVAFSRDQKEKFYVQHRMAEQSREFYAWLQDGASVYVCGDKNRMAHDVHQALVEIISREGAMALEQAEDYVKQMVRDKRYLRDIY
jgi:sulfite reductase (NADPH) flavoprotein alpha-component